MKSIIFWDITPCSPLKINRRFGGIYRLNLQGRRISRARTSVKAGGKQLANCLHAGFLLGFLFDPEDEGGCNKLTSEDGEDKLDRPRK
jgi:hypothetical protein